MTIDCERISKNLEALFCDKLPPDQERLARSHIANCGRCKAEVQALIGIDSVIKKYFQEQLSIAGTPRRRRSSVAYGVAAAAAVVILLVVLMQRPAQVNTGVPPTQTPIPSTAASVEAPETPAKRDTPADGERAKPTVSSAEAASTAANAQPIGGPSSVDPTAPDFLVTDPAGYSRALQDYRGHVLLIGVWDSREIEATANLERLYKAFGSNAKLRFLGVSTANQAKPPNATFPVVYNQGSRLLGAVPGEFILLDETGSVLRRGSLVKDFAALRQQLQER